MRSVSNATAKRMTASTWSRPEELETIEDKLGWFLEDALEGVDDVKSGSAGDFGISCHPTFYGCGVFEEDCEFRSPFVKNGKKVFAGAHSYMNGGGMVNDKVFIGRYCSIGRRVTIGAGAHRTAGVSTSPRLHGRSGTSHGLGANMVPLDARSGCGAKRRGSTTIIENDVWIGDGAVILAGVRIATGAIVGANAVVAADVAAFEVVGGVPARVLKSRFSDDVAGCLLASQWWNSDHEYLCSLTLGNVGEFLQDFDPSAAPRTYRNYRVVSE